MKTGLEMDSLQLGMIILAILPCLQVRGEEGHTCIPVCCPQGQTLLQNQCSVPLQRSKEEKRESLKKENCLSDVENIEDFRKLHFWPNCQKKEEFLLKDVDIKLTKVTKTLSKFVLKHKKGTVNGNLEADYDMETYFSIPSLNSSVDRSPDPIPASFCVDALSSQVITCSRKKLRSSTKVVKCCPFGKELKYPLLSGCTPSDPNKGGLRWVLRVNGHPHLLQDLIRFPYEFVIYNQTFLSDLKTNCQADFGEITFDQNSTMQHRILIDNDAFQVDPHGRIVYSRPLGAFSVRHPIDAGNFCVDSVEKGQQQFMVAIYCSPYPVSHLQVDQMNLMSNFSLRIVNTFHLVLICVGITVKYYIM